MISRIYSRFLFPKEMVGSVFHIDYDKLWQMGIRGLIFDIDNTLATFDVPLPPAEIVDLLAGLQERGFGICLLSNNGKARVEGFSAKMGYPYIWKAKKPGLAGLIRAMKHLSLGGEQVAIIGDQIFTDCLVGNRFGIYTILTKPIANRDEWTVKLKRWPEKVVLRAYARKKL